MSFTIVENVNDFVKARINVTAGNRYLNTLRMAKLTPGTYTIDELITEFNTRVNLARWYNFEEQCTTNQWDYTSGWTSGSGFLDLTYNSSAKTITFVNNRDSGSTHNFYFEHNPSSFTNCEFFRNVVELMPENYQKTPNINELCKKSRTFKSYDYNVPLIYKNTTSNSQTVHFNDTEFIVESMGFLTIEDLTSKGISVTFENNVLTFKGIYNVSGIDYIGSWKYFQNQVKSEINIVYYFTNNNVITIDNSSITLPVNFYNSYQLFNELPEFFTMYYWQTRNSSDIVYLGNPESAVNVTVDIDYNVLLDYTYSVSNLPLFNNSLIPIDYIVINENSMVYSRINYGDTNAIALIPKGIYTKETLAQTINNSLVYTWYSFDNVSLVESESTELKGLVNQIVFENNEITISNNSGHNNYFNYAWNIPDIPIFRNLVKYIYTPEINTEIINNTYTFHENSAVLTIESMGLSQVMYNTSNKSSSTWDIVFRYSEMTEEQESFYGVYRISNNKVNCKQFYAFNDNTMISMNINGVDILFDIYEGFYSFQRLLENLSVSIQRIIHKTFNVVPPEVTIDLNEDNVYKINIPGYTYYFNEIDNDFFNACELIKDFNYSDSTFSYFNNTIDSNCFSITSNNLIINSKVPVYSFDYPIRQDYSTLNSGKYPSFAYYEWDITTLLPNGQGTKMYFKNATKMVGNNFGAFKNSIDCGLYPNSMLLLCFYCSGDIEQDTNCTARFTWFGPNGYGSAWTSTRYYSKVKPVFSMVVPFALPSNKIYEGIEITVNNSDIIVNKILFSVQVFPKGLSGEYYRLKYNDSIQNVSKIFNQATVNYSKIVFPTAGNINQTTFNMNESSENVEINYSENDYNSLTYFFSCLNPWDDNIYSCATFGDLLVNSNRSRYNNRCFTSIPVINCDNYDFATNTKMYSANIRVSVQKFVTNNYIIPENFIDYTKEFTLSDLQDNQSLCVNNPACLYIYLNCSRQEISSSSSVLMTDYEYTAKGGITNGNSITLVNNRFKFTDAGVYSFIVNMYLYPGAIGTNKYLQQTVSFYMGGYYILSLIVDQTQSTVGVTGRVSNGGLFKINTPGEYDLTVNSHNENNTNNAPLIAFAYCDFLITKCY